MMIIFRTINLLRILLLRKRILEFYLKEYWRPFNIYSVQL